MHRSHKRSLWKGGEASFGAVRPTLNGAVSPRRRSGPTAESAQAVSRVVHGHCIPTFRLSALSPPLRVLVARIALAWRLRQPRGPDEVRSFHDAPHFRVSYDRVPFGFFGPEAPRLDLPCGVAGPHALPVRVGNLQSKLWVPDALAPSRGPTRTCCGKRLSDAGHTGFNLGRQARSSGSLSHAARAGRRAHRSDGRPVRQWRNSLPALLAGRVAMFACCFGLVRQIRDGGSQRGAGVAMISAVLLLIISVRQTLLDIVPRPGSGTNSLRMVAANSYLDDR